MLINESPDEQWGSVAQIAVLIAASSSHRRRVSWSKCAGFYIEMTGHWGEIDPMDWEVTWIQDGKDQSLLEMIGAPDLVHALTWTPN